MTQTNVMRTPENVVQPSEALAALGVPHIEQYFTVWAIQEDPFRAAVDRLQGLNLHAHVQAQAEEPKAQIRGEYQTVNDSIAVISLSGPLMKHVGSLSAGTSTVAARRSIRAAVEDARISKILLHVDSPGGTVSGTSGLADDVAWAASRKTLWAQVDDVAASAAYWIAAQATKVFANRTAMVGAIGTFAVIYDMSERADRLGIKVHVLRAGKFKGAGVDGTEITTDQLAEWQRLVDELNEHFVGGVAQGRRMELAQVRAIADGRVHLAADAGSMGLIDGVQDMDTTLDQLSKARNQGTAARAAVKENETMTAENDTPSQTTTGSTAPANTVVVEAPATLKQLKDLCPGSTAEFREECLTEQRTPLQASTAWATHLSEKNAELAEAAKAKRPGVDTPGVASPAKKPGAKDAEAAEATGDPIEDFNGAVSAAMTRGLDRKKAIRAVARNDPDLHAAYIEACNPGATGIREAREATSAHLARR